MFLIYGQFWNQTKLCWDWQQIGGTATNEEDAHQFAYGFAVNYCVPCKVVGRQGITLYLPPVKCFGDSGNWPSSDGFQNVILTH